jgi:hypothetical protein
MKKILLGLCGLLLSTSLTSAVQAMNSEATSQSTQYQYLSQDSAGTTMLKGECVDFIDQQNLKLEEQKQAFATFINEMRKKQHPLWLVIGESGVAPHALTRFSKLNWIFLDPNRTLRSIIPNNGNMPQLMEAHRRIGLRGFISHLEQLPMVRGQLDYIMDDVDALSSECHPFSDYQKDLFFQKTQKTQKTTADTIIFLYQFLKDGGMIATSLSVLIAAWDELPTLKNMYDVKYGNSCSKPFKSMAFSEVDTSHQILILDTAFKSVSSAQNASGTLWVQDPNWKNERQKMNRAKQQIEKCKNWAPPKIDSLQDVDETFFQDCISNIENKLTTDERHALYQRAAEEEEEGESEGESESRYQNLNDSAKWKCLFQLGHLKEDTTSIFFIKKPAH